jgi:acetoin utilization deacetylase AcuC-like enzyme
MITKPPVNREGGDRLGHRNPLRPRPGGQVEENHFLVALPVCFTRCYCAALQALPKDAMRVVYSPKHHLHNPTKEVQFGTPLPMYEIPERAESIRRALEGDGGFKLEDPREHGTTPITTVHDEGLVRYLEHAWSNWRTLNREAPAMIPDTVLHPAIREGMGPSPEPKNPLARLGYWCWETMTPVVPGSYLAALACVDVALSAAELVLSGESAVYALCRPPGHHSPRRAFGGYCFFNAVSVATQYLVEVTGEAMAILDVDYHHGNGSQQIFYGRKDVLYCSIHGHPDRAYPYFTGWEDETGAGEGEGFNVNLPLRAGCPDDEYLDAVDRLLATIADHPGSIVVISLGFDTYGQDPISDFALTTPAYHEIGKRVAGLGRKMLIVQEGGYFVPQLGENARQWLRGAEGRSLDLAPAAAPHPT